MTLSAAHLLPPILSTRFAAYAARLSRLRIDYPSTGMRVSPQPYPQAFTQCFAYGVSPKFAKNSSRIHRPLLAWGHVLPGWARGRRREDVYQREIVLYTRSRSLRCWRAKRF